MRVRADRATDSTCGAQRRPERWAKAEPYGRCHAEARKLRAPYALGVQRTPNIWRTDGSVDLEALVGVLGTLQLLKRHELTGQTGLLPALTAARRYELAGLLGELGEISYPARGLRLPELVGELESIALTYGVDLPSLLGELGELATTRRYDLDALLGETPEITVENGGGSNPYYDAGANHYYELSDNEDANGDADLTLVGSPSLATDGAYGKCLTLNGSSQYAYDASGDIAGAVAANGHSVRVRMLIKFDTDDVNSCPIAFGSTSFAVLIRNTGNFEMRWGSGTSRVSVAGFWSGITTGQWHELRAEFGWLYENGAYKGCRAYLDDNLIGSSNTNLYDGATIGNLHIGQFGVNPNWYLDGAIDEVAITTPCVPPV